MRQRGRRKRGYSVAMLVGLEASFAVLWKVFSNVVKHEKTVQFGGARNDLKALYNFHEALINALRPTLNEGVRSVVLVSPAKGNYGKSFVAHVQLHHAWLSQGVGKVVFSEIVGSADTLPKVAALVKNAEFRQAISETTAEEAELLVGLLEKRLAASSQDALVFYSLGDIEGLILSVWKPGKPKPEYLLLTDAYLAGSRAKARLHRLMQIAANRNVKTRIVDSESPAGVRVGQLGGLVLLAAAA